MRIKMIDWVNTNNFNPNEWRSLINLTCTEIMSSFQEHLQVVYYNCVKFHKNPISCLGGVALTRYMDGRTG